MSHLANNSHKFAYFYHQQINYSPPSHSPQYRVSQKICYNPGNSTLLFFHLVLFYRVSENTDNKCINPIQTGGHNVPPSVSPLFVVQLQPNLACWYSGQNLSKTIKLLLTSSPRGKYDVIKLFLVLFQVKIRVPLSFVQWS